MTERARDLTRGRRTPRKVADTGRQHHLGAAPAAMPVLDTDGHAETTRTAAVQLAARTVYELTTLAAAIVDEMTAAATALEFERAALLRDESEAVRAELARRA